MTLQERSAVLYGFCLSYMVMFLIYYSGIITGYRIMGYILWKRTLDDNIVCI